jgi:flagellar basal-body rod modification protein FlgD
MTVAAATSSSALNSVLSSQGSSAAAPSATDQSDRFLKLLVTQMQNQDPLNPMDNAQVTTQMAQISTVSGIDKLNATIAQMNSVLLQSQSLQGAALVGKSVLVAGQDLALDASGKAGAGFDLASAADSVVVSVTNASGKVIDTVDLGPQDAGRHVFDYQAKTAGMTGLSFSVGAKAGAQAVSATPLVADTVSAVYADGTQLTIELRNHGNVNYSDVKAVY